MADKLKQEANENALAVQAGRDINIGMSFSEIERLFTILFENNFPKLQEIAARTAQDNVAKFVKGLKTAFIANSYKIDIYKISDPDVQYMFNDIMEASARRGDKINPELLSELVVERLSNNSTDMIGLICSEAIEVIPKLTKEQIAFITLCHFISRVTYPGILDVIRFEPYGRIVAPLVAPCKTISETSKEFLAYAGILNISTFLGNGLYDGLSISNVYPFLKGLPEDEIRKRFESYAPSYYSIMKLYDECEAYQINLTAIGKMIALVNLKRVLPQVDYKIWLN
ncbi:MAG: hypothetical protein FWE10_00130 [Rikenellaceae bacterium]|nr:hypothetical protein [Rikenellaceae bacterium]MCL2692148.1 hypothetical protein [Rikenellaceae bacterium]